MLILLPWTFSSCEKLLIPENPPNTPEHNFEVFWQTFDERYSFFEFKNIDWDSVYVALRPRVQPAMHDTDLFNIYREVMMLLKDGHFSLSSTVSPTIFYGWFNGQPNNFDVGVLTKNYLKVNFTKVGPIIVKKFGQAGYLYYNDLSERLSDENMLEIMEALKGTKGVIVDIRGNVGGEVINAEKFASYFNDFSRLVGYWLFKTGKGRNDFTAPMPYYVNGVGENVYKNPVVLLTNRRIFSAANDLAMMFKALPNVTLIGDTTGGGGGIPMHFELPNGWIIALPTTQTLDAERFNIEHGIPPDITIIMTEKDIESGIDPLMEAAFKLLN
ncbi:MAG: S41 family peptidase [Bacteroidetes bacterium]|nr:S41 family peptidase [Bacteroidota bacterium]